MAVKTGSIRRTLMCKDVPVVDFAYDPSRRVVTWRGRPENHDFAPIGATSSDGRLTRPGLSGWLTRRAIPETRPRLKRVLGRLGLPSPEALMLSGHGASLSDQYWFRPIGDTAMRWRDVSPFENGIGDLLGDALTGSADESERAIARLRRDGLMASCSPDAALCGNLPKRWVVDGGERVLVKGGKGRNRFQEPLNEAIGSELCSRVLLPGDYVRYRLVSSDQPGPAWLSACPCMVDADHELVSAHDVIRAWRCDNSRSRYENLVDACLAHGITDVRTSLSKMLVVDHVLANWDRHWGNFGVIVNSETRRWERVAPLYDMGESLWCDRRATLALSKPYRLEYPTPFLRDIHRQLGRFADSLDWLAPERLEGFDEHVREALSVTQVVACDDEWLDKVTQKVRERMREVCEAANDLAPKRLSVCIERGISLEEAVGRKPTPVDGAKDQERTSLGRG